MSHGPAERHADALRRFKADVFQALAHPTRVHIVECLCGGEMSVHELLEKVGVEPANLSQHLSALRARGLVVNRQEGRQVFYSLRDPMLKPILGSLRDFFLTHLEELMATLREADDSV